MRSLRGVGVTVAIAVIFIVTLQGAPVFDQAAAGQEQPSASASRDRPDERAFITDMMMANRAEVELGKLASQRAANADVKAFGQEMVTDHSSALKELQSVASRQKVEVAPQLDAKHQAHVDHLSKLQGAEFDREYMSVMVSGHQEVLTKMRGFHGGAAMPGSTASAGAERPPAAGTERPPATTAGERPGTRPGESRPMGTGAQKPGTGTGSGPLHQWIIKTMPDVEQHLKRAQELQQKVSRG